MNSFSEPDPMSCSRAFSYILISVVGAVMFQKEDNLTVKTGASNLFKNTDERDGYTRAT